MVFSVYVWDLVIDAKAPLSRSTRVVISLVPVILTGKVLEGNCMTMLSAAIHQSLEGDASARERLLTGGFALLWKHIRLDTTA